MRRGDNLHPLGKGLRQQREYRLGIRPVWILEAGVLIDSIDEEDRGLGSTLGTAHCCRSTQQFAELGALRPLMHALDVLVFNNFRELRTPMTKTKFPLVVPIATDAADEEGRHVNAVGRIQCDVLHNGRLATDHVLLHGVPGIVRPEHERFKTGHLHFSFFQMIRSELAKHVDVLIADERVGILGNHERPSGCGA